PRAVSPPKTLCGRGSTRIRKASLNPCAPTLMTPTSITGTRLKNSGPARCCGMAETDSACPALTLQGVGFAFGKTPVLSGISLQLAPGTFFSLLGPSGGGKTTLLKLIGG